MSHGNAYYKRTFGLAVARSWQRFRHRAPRWLPPIGEASLLATLARNFRWQIGDSLLAGLASARADPVEILEDTLPKLIAARSALWIANAAGLDPDTTYDIGDCGYPMSAAQLLDLIERLESVEAQVRELVALVDARLSDYLPVVSGSMH